MSLDAGLKTLDKEEQRNEKAAEAFKELVDRMLGKEALEYFWSQTENVRDYIRNMGGGSLYLREAETIAC